MDNNYGNYGYNDNSYGSNDYGISSQGSMPMAVLGAVIGSIPGIVLWIILGQIGFIAAIAGAVIAGGTIMGYTKIGKREIIGDKAGKIICVIIVIVAIYASIHIDTTFSVLREVKNDAMWKLKFCLTYHEKDVTFSTVSKHLYKVCEPNALKINFAVGYGLGILGAFGVLRKR